MFDEAVMDNEVSKAVEVLRQGGVILYPTDTVWGIGCDATNAEAVAKVFAIKQRDDNKAMIILVDGENMVLRCIKETPEVAWQLWEVSDKPLTLILPGAVWVAKNLVPEQGTLAIRITRDDFCRRVIRKLGRPLVSTSANVSGDSTPLNFAEISEQIKSKVDLVVDPKMQSPKATGKPSSIISLGLGSEINIIRP